MHAAILNAGPGAWVFQTLPEDEPPSGGSLIPFGATQLAGDKRETARAFGLLDVPISETPLIADQDELLQVLAAGA